MLASEAVFVLDAGASHGVWAWVGKAATETEKREGLALAVSFVEKTHRSSMEVPVVRVMEGSETAAFIRYVYVMPGRCVLGRGVSCLDEFACANPSTIVS
jgi:hypothetical protein